MAKKLPPSIAESLRKAIATSGMSAYALGKQTEVPQQMISRFLIGKDIRLETADKLAKYFGLSLSKQSKG